MSIHSFRLFLIIIFSIVALALIIIGIIIFIKWRKKRKKEDLTLSRNSINEINLKTSRNEPVSNRHIYNNNNNINNDGNNINNNINNNSISKKVKKEKDFLTKEMKINGYLDCFLKPVKYSLINVFNESCPIDLIPFNENEEVSVTKCLHAFHYNCIKKYLLENENHHEYKCPICLTVLFEV